MLCQALRSPFQTPIQPLVSSKSSSYTALILFCCDAFLYFVSLTLIDLKDKIVDLLNCNGDETLMGILELDYLVTDLENKVSCFHQAWNKAYMFPKVTQGISQAKTSTLKFNETSLFNNALSELNTLINNSNIDFLKGSNISALEV
jgi:hypothetical protein